MLILLHAIPGCVEDFKESQDSNDTFMFFHCKEYIIVLYSLVLLSRGNKDNLG